MGISDNEFKHALKEHQQLRRALWEDLRDFLPAVERHKREVGQLYLTAIETMAEVQRIAWEAERSRSPWSPATPATASRREQKRAPIPILSRPETREIVSRLREAGSGPLREVTQLAANQSAAAISLAVWLDARECYIWEDRREHQTDIIVERAGVEIIRISAEYLFGTRN